MLVNLCDAKVVDLNQLFSENGKNIFVFLQI